MNYKYPARKHLPRLSTPVRLGVAAVAACFIAGPALANPVNPTVVNGAASFNQAGNVLTVTNSNGAIINWDKFSIKAGETTHFAQTAASSSVLNRVLNDPTTIYGTLSSNGRVWLVNPAGIMVGPGGRVDTAGFVASTLNISNENFLAGRKLFDSTTGAGNVINQGQITTPTGGSVYLIGSNVSNEGIITTPQGETILAAGQTVSLIDSATPGVKVDITGAAGNATNLGTITAEAGRIGIAGVIVRNSGTLNASSVVSEGGRIFLRASKDAYVEGQGKVLATGTKGGSIEVTGNRVAVIDQAQLDASGMNGGGTVLVGGDAHGANPNVQNAQQTVVGPDVLIKVDATKVGDGGTAVVWADGDTRFYGSVSARGGTEGGNGGFVETSGKQTLAFAGSVDTRAPKGKTGTLLLDPDDIVIADVPAGTASQDLSFSPAGTILYGSGSGTYTISTGTLEALSASTDIDLQAGNTITMGPIVGIAGGGGAASANMLTLQQDGAVSMWALNGKIDLGSSNTINIVGTGSLYLEAGSTINVGPIITHSGSVTLTSGTSDGGVTSSVITGSSITTHGGNITLTGGGYGTSGVTVGDLDTSGVAGSAGFSPGIPTYSAGSGNWGSDGGTVTITAPTTITTGTITTRGGAGGDGGNAVGASAANYAPYTPGGSGGSGGKGGDVLLNVSSSSGSIHTGSIDSSGGQGGKGGNTTGEFDYYYYYYGYYCCSYFYANPAGDGGSGGRGGNLALNVASGPINGPLLTVGSGSGSINTSGGAGGIVGANTTSLYGNAGYSYAGYAGQGGLINVTASSGDITFGALPLSFGTLTTGGGDLQFAAGGNINLTGNINFGSNVDLSPDGTVRFRAVNNINLASHSITTNGKHIVLSANDDLAQAFPTFNTLGGTGAVIGGGNITTNGGNLDITGVGAAVGTLNTSGLVDGSNWSGNVNITTTDGDITTGAITTRALNPFSSGGDVSLQTGAGNILVAGNIDTHGANGDINNPWGSSGGNIHLVRTDQTTTGSVSVTGSILTYSGNSLSDSGANAGSGGDVYIAGDWYASIPVNGAVNVGSIDAHGGAGAPGLSAGTYGGNGGNGGRVQLFASGAVTAAAIDTHGGVGGTGADGDGLTRGGDGGEGGYGGQAVLSSSTADVTVGAINTSGGNAGDGGAYGGNGGDNWWAGDAGNVTLSAPSGNVRFGSILAIGGNGGNGGDGLGSFSGGSGGDGGLSGYVEINRGLSVAISAGGTGKITTTGANGGNGGSGTPDGDQGSWGGRGGQGKNGGDVDINSPNGSGGAVTIGSIDTRGGNGGAGGAAATEYDAYNGGDGGHGGYVWISGTSISTKGDGIGAIITKGGNGGNGGNSGLMYSYSGAGGNAGYGESVYFDVAGGAVNTGAIDTRGGKGGNAGIGATGYYGGDGGWGGSVEMYGTSAITTGTITTRGGDGGHGGGDGYSNYNQYIDYSHYSAGYGGDGGGIFLQSTGAINVGAIDVSGGNGGSGGLAPDGNTYSGGTGGNGGRAAYDWWSNVYDMSIHGASVTTGTITARGGSGGNGGGDGDGYSPYSGGSGGTGSYVELTASGSVLTGSIDTRGGDGGIGLDGASFNAGGDGGDGGPGGNVWISAASISTLGDLVGAITTGGGNGGNGGASDSQAGAGGNAGYGGYVYLNAAGGTVNTGDIDTRGGKGGNAGIGSLGLTGGDGGWGAVEMYNTSSITTGLITTLGGDGGHGGGWYYLNGYGNWWNSNQYTDTSHTGAGYGGDGGGINLQSSGAISVVGIDASGGNGGFSGGAPDGNYYSAYNGGRGGDAASGWYRGFYGIYLSGASITVGGGVGTISARGGIGGDDFNGSSGGNGGYVDLSTTSVGGTVAIGGIYTAGGTGGYYGEGYGTSGYDDYWNINADKVVVTAPSTDFLAATDWYCGCPLGSITANVFEFDPAAGVTSLPIYQGSFNALSNVTTVKFGKDNGTTSADLVLTGTIDLTNTFINTLSLKTTGVVTQDDSSLGASDAALAVNNLYAQGSSVTLIGGPNWNGNYVTNLRGSATSGDFVFWGSGWFLGYGYAGTNIGFTDSSITGVAGITAAGIASLDSEGALTQTAPIIATGLNAWGNTVTLNDPNNSVTTLQGGTYVVEGSIYGDFAFTNSGGLVIGTVVPGTVVPDYTLYYTPGLSQSGNASLTVGGALTQTAPAFVTGALTVSATGDVILTDPGNQIGGQIDIATGTTGAINLNNASSLTTLGNISGAWLYAYGAGDVNVVGTVTGPGGIHIEAGSSGNWSPSISGGNLSLAPGSMLDAGSSFIELVAYQGANESTGIITATGSEMFAGAGGVYVQADSNIGLGQITSFGGPVSIYTSNGAITGAGTNLAPVFITSGGGDIDLTGGSVGSSQPYGINLDTVQLDSGGGMITLNGYGSIGGYNGSGAGVRINNSSVNSFGGAISITGYGGIERSGIAYSDGVEIFNSIISSQPSVAGIGGDLSIVGSGGDYGASWGVSIGQGSTVDAYGGLLSIIGTGGLHDSPDGASHGVVLGGASGSGITTITSAGGIVQITGVGGGDTGAGGTAKGVRTFFDTATIIGDTVTIDGTAGFGGNAIQLGDLGYPHTAISSTGAVMITGTGGDVVIAGDVQAGTTVGISGTGIDNTGGTITATTLSATADSGMSLTTAVANLNLANTTSGVVQVSNTGAVNINGITLGGGDLTLNATGTVTNSATSLVDIQGGSATINSNLTNNGTINLNATGAANTLTVTGNLTLAPTSVLNVAMNGTAPGQYGKLNVTGGAVLDGSLAATNGGGYVPASADFAPFLTMGGTTSGNFATTSLPVNFNVGYSLATGEAARLIYSLAGTIAFLNTNLDLNWATSANWSGGALPGSGDTALISAGYAVMHPTGADTVGALTISSGNSLNISGGSLSVLGGTTLEGGFMVSGTGSATLGGALSGSGTGQVTVSGGSLILSGGASLAGYTQSAGAVSGAGTFATNQGFNQTGGSLSGFGTAILGDTSASPLSIATLSAGSVTASGSSGVSVVSGGQITTTATGRALVLDAGAGNFVNAGGATALNATNGGSWLVYSADPTTIGKGGLTSNFRHYGVTSATYAPVSVTETGNGFVYSSAAGNLTVTTGLASGTASNTYGVAPTATFAYTLAGFADAEDTAGNIGLGGAIAYTLTPALKTNAGSYTVAYANGLSSVAGYGFAPGTGVAYTVNKAALTISAVTDTKVYDGTPSSSVAPSMTGLVSGDTVSSLTQAFANKNVLGTNGSTLSVNAGYAVADGNAGGNYIITTNTAAGTITPAPLTLAAVTQSKVYDGTTSSTGVVGVTGLMAGDSVTGTSQSYASKNVLGTNGSTLAVNAGYALADGNPVPGNNYVVTLAPAAGTITQRPLSTWIGGASGNWSLASNWDALPDLSNVLAVSVPAGKTAIYDAAAGITNLGSVTAAGLTIAGGTLNIASNLTVSSNFSQTGGALAFGGGASASITQASGNLVMPGIAVANLSLNAPTGAITQTGPLAALTLVTNSQGATTLTDPANQITGGRVDMTAGGPLSLWASGDLNLGVINAGANAVQVKAGGAILQAPGALGTTNIIAGAADLQSIFGGVAGGLAISADTQVTGALTASVGTAANNGGIRIMNTGASPTSVVLADNALAGASVSFLNTGNITNTSGISLQTRNGGDLGLFSNGSLTWTSGSLSTPSGSVLVGAIGPVAVTGALSSPVDLALTSGTGITVSGSVIVGGTGTAAMVAPNVTINGTVSAADDIGIIASAINFGAGSNTSAGHDIVLGAANITATNATVTAGLDILAAATGDMHLNGSGLTAGNDIFLTLTSPTSMLYLNDAAGLPRSFLWAQAPSTVHLAFPARNDGGVVVDGTPVDLVTFKAAPGASGFFYSNDMVAVLNTGLEVTYASGSLMAPAPDDTMEKILRILDPMPDTEQRQQPASDWRSGYGIGDTDGEFGGEDRNDDKDARDEATGLRKHADKSIAKKLGTCSI